MQKNSITVILVAHKRKEFILEAAKSVLDQTIDKSLFELVVVKNLRDPDIDQFLLNHGIKNINSDIEGLGGKLSEALAFANGSIISFLEDDDLFLPGKLDHVLNVFSNNPSTVFYHNAALFINRAGKELMTKRSDPGFNISCMSLRKESIYNSCMGKVTNSLDLFLFCNGMDAGKTRTIYDDSILTLYRIHDTWSNNLKWTFEEYIDSYINLPQTLLEDLEYTRKCMKSNYVKRMLDDRSISYRIEYISALILRGKATKYNVKFSEIFLWMAYPYHLNSMKKYPLKILFVIERYGPIMIKRRILRHFYSSDSRSKLSKLVS